MQCLSLQSAIPLGLVLGFARRYCLPLHVARGVGSAALQRLDMIDHVAGAPPLVLPWTGTDAAAQRSAWRRLMFIPLLRWLAPSIVERSHPSR